MSSFRNKGGLKALASAMAQPTDTSEDNTMNQLTTATMRRDGVGAGAVGGEVAL